MFGPTTYTSWQSRSALISLFLEKAKTHVVSRNNANAALVFEFCYRFISIAKAYFGKVDEESVKSNFVLIYELIDGVSE